MNISEKMPRVLSIAGSDSGGGAGIQADIKAITALGGFAMTALTALTAQNTLGVQKVLAVEPDMVRAQIESVISDIGVDSIKIGMLATTEIIEAVSLAVQDFAPDIPVVLDPVMIATSTDRLLEASAEKALIETLVPMATVITPNIPESHVFAEFLALGRREGAPFAQALADHLGVAVLLKGGHLRGDMVEDVLVVDGEVHLVEHDRIKTLHAHGTGCTLAAALATAIGAGYDLPAATQLATDYVHQALLAAPGLGTGHGPLGHMLSKAVM